MNVPSGDYVEDYYFLEDQLRNMPNRASPQSADKILRMVNSLVMDIISRLGLSYVWGLIDHIRQHVSGGNVIADNILKILESSGSVGGGRFLWNTETFRSTIQRMPHFVPQRRDPRTCYPMQRKDALLLIINEYQPPSFGALRASAANAELITELFYALGFQLYKQGVSWNLTQQEMADKITEFASDPVHNNHDASVVAISSHGTNDGTNDFLSGVDGQLLGTDVIQSAFDRTQCPALFGKPKIFLFVGCRGDQSPGGSPDPNVPATKAIVEDSGVILSAQPGYASYSPTDGCMFLHHLTDVVSKPGNVANLDLPNILKLVDSEAKNQAALAATVTPPSQGTQSGPAFSTIAKRKDTSQAIDYALKLSRKLYLS